MNPKELASRKDLALKYREDETLSIALEYIKTTYGQHYVGNDGVQVMDLYQALGSAETTCRDTAIKYLSRWGKKEGKNKKDLLKAMHYICLLWNFAYNTEEKSQHDETFNQRCY
jgi:hypothetical protein